MDRLDLESRDLSGQVILVTGSTGGMGREIARSLAGMGGHVIVHGRNVERGEALVAEIEAGGKGSARFYPADLASFAEVRELAGRIRQDYDRLDVLINNAGITLALPDPPVITEDGNELHLQVNYLSGFLLTHELLPLLRASAPARIINVSSEAQQPIDLDDPDMRNGYERWRAYGQSKLAQVLFTFELDDRLAHTGVTVNAVHPASLMDTDMVIVDIGVEPRVSVDVGRDAVLRLVLDPEAGSGRYYDIMRPARANPQAYDEQARDRLWRLSEERTGVPTGG